MILPSEISPEEELIFCNIPTVLSITKACSPGEKAALELSPPLGRGGGAFSQLQPLLNFEAY